MNCTRFSMGLAATAAIASAIAMAATGKLGLDPPSPYNTSLSEAAISQVETIPPHQEEHLQLVGKVLQQRSVHIPTSYLVVFETPKGIKLSATFPSKRPAWAQVGERVWVCFFNDKRVDQHVISVSGEKTEQLPCGGASTD